MYGQMQGAEPPNPRDFAVKPARGEGEILGEEELGQSRKGRRKHADDAPRLTERCEFRATPAEKEAIERNAREAGYRPSEYLRRKALEKPDYSQAQLLEMANVRKELRAHGKNLNQIARVLNDAALKASARAEYWEKVSAAVAAVEELRRMQEAVYAETERVFRLL